MECQVDAWNLSIQINFCSDAHSANISKALKDSKKLQKA